MKTILVQTDAGRVAYPETVRLALPAQLAVTMAGFLNSIATLRLPCGACGQQMRLALHEGEKPLQEILGILKRQILSQRNDQVLDAIREAEERT